MSLEVIHGQGRSAAGIVVVVSRAAGLGGYASRSATATGAGLAALVEGAGRVIAVAIIDVSWLLGSEVVGVIVDVSGLLRWKAVRVKGLGALKGLFRLDLGLLLLVSALGVLKDRVELFALQYG